jgi:hypothetical protein
MSYISPESMPRLFDAYRPQSGNQQVAGSLPESIFMIPYENRLPEIFNGGLHGNFTSRL